MYACIRMFSKNKLSYSFSRLKHNLIKFVLRACWYKITIFLANTVRASKRTSLFFLFINFNDNLYSRQSIICTTNQWTVHVLGITIGYTSQVINNLLLRNISKGSKITIQKCQRVRSSPWEPVYI